MRKISVIAFLIVMIGFFFTLVPLSWAQSRKDECFNWKIKPWPLIEGQFEKIELTFYVNNPMATYTIESDGIWPDRYRVENQKPEERTIDSKKVGYFHLIITPDNGRVLFSSKQDHKITVYNLSRVGDQKICEHLFPVFPPLTPTSTPIPSDQRCLLKITSNLDSEGRMFTPKSKIFIEETPLPDDGYLTQRLIIIDKTVGKIIWERKFDFFKRGVERKIPTMYLGTFAVGVYLVKVQYFLPGVCPDDWCDSKVCASREFGICLEGCKPTQPCPSSCGMQPTPTPLPMDCPYKLCFPAGASHQCHLPQCFQNCPLCPNYQPPSLIPTPDLTKLCAQVVDLDSTPNWNEHDECLACVTGQQVGSVPPPKKPGLYTAIGCIPTDIIFILKDYIFKYGLGIAGGIAFLLMIFGGFTILVSKGNPEQVAKGKELITSALAGLLIVIFSIFILRLIGVVILKIPGFK